MTEPLLVSKGKPKIELPDKHLVGVKPAKKQKSLRIILNYLNPQVGDF